MKKLLLFAPLFFLFAACCEKVSEEISVPENGVESRSVSDIVPIEEALNQMQSFREALNPTTRAVLGLPVIESIAVSGGRALSRSGEIEIPDTMVYVVNFADDKGFAVLGARRSLEEIYAFTESGSLDARRLDAAMARIRSKKETRAVPEKSSGPDLIYDMLGGVILDTLRPTFPYIPEPAPSSYVLDSIYDEWSVTGDIAPIVISKWNQTHPFNMSMPESPHFDNIYYGGHSPVGCGIVAIAQVMAAVRHPLKAPAGDDTFYEWNHLLSVSNYETLPLYYPGKYGNENPDNTRKLSEVLAYLAKCSRVQCTPEGTLVSVGNIARMLMALDPNFYSGIGIPEYEGYRVRNMLQKGIPVYMEGYTRATKEGHAWVVDGMISRCLKRHNVYRHVDTGEIQEYIKIVQYDDLFHVNWGYSGACDGYYTAGVFDETQRRWRHEAIDANIDAENEYTFKDNFDGRLFVMEF